MTKFVKKGTAKSQREKLEEILDEDEMDLHNPKYDTAGGYNSVSKTEAKKKLENYQSLKNGEKKIGKSKTPNKKRINKTPPPQRKPKMKSKESKNILDFSTNKGSFKSKKVFII